MFDIIKRRYQQRQLNSLLNRQRDKRIDNWEQIKTIGLIFTVGDVERWNLIHRFISAQESRGKEVHLIGFQEANYEINYIFSHTRTIICHEKEDLNFFGLPKDGVVDGFVKKHFDLIIDTTEQPDFFGKYITAMTDANLKVGYTNTESDRDEGIMEMYDMAIQGNDAMDFKNYIEQIVKYLTMIQK
ncbi:MAG: hypothetical protein J6X86_08640 [Bacteroidales bacterium]|nr:hypothetical protein [Bacteroidales bacterium]MBP5516996.1 hypothetical protein [Bacteroidales bacterium]